MSTLHFNPDTSTLFLRPAEKAVGQRIDRSIVEALQESSFMGSPALQYIRNAIEEGRISLNQKKVCSPFELLEEVDSTISIVVPQEEQEAHELVLEVLEETDTFTAIWKPSGIPLDGPKKDALAPSVEAQFLSYGQEAFLRHAFRIKPLILNRLERWSEGIVIVFHSFAPYRRAQRHLETHPEHLRFRCLIRGGTPAAKNLLNLAQGILIENGTDICLSPEIVQSSSILRPDGTHFTVAEASENSLLLEVC
ncbi:MAG: hypothetical protein KDD64_11795, partial [Bdellovibrionales bacterium]|nr:hypothetical protein [Bdellovibrionales bacterium]